MNEENIPQKNSEPENVNANHSEQEIIQPAIANTTNMEVQKHPHHVTHKKKWGEYLLEFLMLFLAVFLGFVAENWREHTVEHEREKQYIRSMIDDVKLDTASLNVISQRRILRRGMFDSLSDLLNSSQRNYFVPRLYYFARQIQRLSPVIFTYNDRTIQQLKYGGNMRLIRTPAVTDAIVLYDAAVRDLNSTEEREDNYMAQCLPHIYKLFNGRVMDMMVDSLGAIHEPPTGISLLTFSESNLADFNGSFHSMKSSNKVILVKMKMLIGEGEKLLNILQK